jgi:hypothetical protein
MRSGLEPCRVCGTTAELSFGHLIPFSDGGRYALDNLTIVCIPCNEKQGDAAVAHLPSLHEEETNAPPERRWAALAGSVSGQRPLHPDRIALIPSVREVLTRIYPLAIDGLEVAAELGFEHYAPVRAALKSLRRSGEATCDPEGRWAAVSQ